MKKKSLEEVLKENKKTYRERLEEQRKQAHKENIKETILFWFVAMFIIISTIIMLNNLNSKDISRCEKIGYSKSICNDNIK